MATGIAEFGRLTDQPELLAWAKRVYDWIGRTHTTTYGWVADASGSSICESCAIASRARLGLALYRAGMCEPFREIDRHLRNQLLENQFRDLSFVKKFMPETARTDKTTYAGVDAMIRGTFQCWGAANDLIGHPDIEECGAGGGVQGLALAWSSQAEWRDGPNELRVNLLFNRIIRAPGDGKINHGTPPALELWSYLPWEGRIVAVAHRAIPKVSFRLPEGVEEAQVWLSRDLNKPVPREGQFAVVQNVLRGDRLELIFPLREYTTIETVRTNRYEVRWRGPAVVGLEPRGATLPLYTRGEMLRRGQAPVTEPRYP